MASTSTSSMTSEEHQVKKYDVFVSFRGEDIRYGFLTHLSAALHRKKILTFIDDKLEKGERISGALFKAIKDSKLSIVIFSENFAFSTWCLKEVAKIIRCRKRMGQMIVPVFYHVEPTHVRKQSGSFAEAFAGHEEKYKKEKVEKWRSALTKAANLSGWHQASATSSENQLVEDIVRAVLTKLNQKSSINSEGYVGIHSRIEQIESSLCIGMARIHTRTIGIWGMGGIGKTTIAELIFERLRSQFEAYHFVPNVREECEKHGLAHLRKVFFPAILEDETLNKVSSIMGRNTFVKDRLRRSQVLIVLDDVDNVEQLESLAGSSDCFGPGSRVIITTRDKQVLQGRVDEIYEVKALSDCDALQLFSQYAFGRDYPTEDFEMMSRKVAKYANGNPLALKVLGAALICKSIEVWESVLNKLEKTPLKKIQEILKISYDGLDKEEKCIFLDIACFFKGENKDDVTRILDGCGFHTQFGLSILVDKSLVAIEDNKIWMHDLLQKMGRAIVFDESQHPGERSRLWIPKEAYDVLRKSKGTEAVEGIILDLVGLNDDHFPAKTFARMKKLRVLKITDSNRLYYSKNVCQVHLSQGLDCLPEELRFLWWHGYPIKSLPCNFDMENLVHLDLRFSNIVEPWNGVQDLPNLKIINLSYCQNLIRTPDFSKAPNLESIELGRCTGLLELHPSIGALDNLTELDLNVCKKVRNFPGSIHLKSLKVLYISWWSNETAIEELQKSIKNLTGLNRLTLYSCEGLKSLPSSFCQLQSLEELSLISCSNFESFPEILKNMDALRKLNLHGTAVKELPSSIGNLGGLGFLDLTECKNLVSLPRSISKLKSLKEIRLNRCSKFESFPEILENMEALKWLLLDETAVKELPSSIDNLSRLVHLSMTGCKNLKSLPSSFSNLKSLKFLNLENCSKLESFFCCSSSCQSSCGLCNLSSLEDLHLCRTNIETIPACIKRLSHLEHLCLDDCRRLQSIGEVPLSLQKINAYGCTSLKTINFSSIPIDALIEDIAGLSWSLNFCNCLELDQWSILEAIFEPVEFLRTGSSGASKTHNFHGTEEEFKPIVSLLAPGSEIPGWFSERSVGSSITIKVHPNSFDGNFMTVDMCAVLECEQTSGYPFYIECECLFGTEFCQQSIYAWFIFGDAEHIGRSLTTDSGHTLVSHGYFYMQPDNNNCPTHASFHFKEVWQGAKVKECGINLYNAGDDKSPLARTKRYRDEENNSFRVIQLSTPEDFVSSHRDSGEPMKESPSTRMKRCRDYSIAEAEQPSTEQTAQPSSPPLLISVATCQAGAPMMGYMASPQGVISMDGNTVSSGFEEEPPSKRLQNFEWL